MLFGFPHGKFAGGNWTTLIPLPVLLFQLRLVVPIDRRPQRKSGKR